MMKERSEDEVRGWYKKIPQMRTNMKVEITDKCE